MFAIKIQLSIKIEKNNIKIRSNLAAASLYMAYHCNKDDRQIGKRSLKMLLKIASSNFHFLKTQLIFKLL